jgi:hypothetical protein
MKSNPNFSFRFAILTLAAMQLLGCQFLQQHSVQSGAEKIRIFEAEPKGCLFMGEVSAVQDNGSVAVHNGEADMSLNTRIDLRNSAFKQNGNVLVFTPKGKARLAGSIAPTVDKKDPKATEAKVEAASADKTSSEPAPEQTVFLGTVFRCPPLIFNQ